MTSIVLSLSLILTPAPIAPGHAPGSEGVRLGSAAVLHPLTAAEPAPDYWKDYQPWPPSHVANSAPIPATSPPGFDLLISMEAEPVGSAPTPTAVLSVSSDPPPSSTGASSGSTDAPASLTDAQLYRLRMCESTDRYGVDTGNGYWGAYQFDQQTWDGVAGRHLPWLVGVKPNLAWPDEQDAMTRWLWSERGRQPWPVCGYKVGAP